MAEYLYGSAAYDFVNTVPAELPAFPEREREVPGPEAVPRPEEREVVHTGIKAEPRSRVQISLFVLVFVPVLLLGTVMLLFSYMKLSTLSDQSAALNTQLQELKTDQTRLQIRYESTFDLAEVETYAKTVLGMVKAGADQTTFVRSTVEDRAQVLTEQNWFADWERRLDAFARRVQAYFR